MNKKGFALTETLVVIVFLVSIFTFIYVSILPLLGKYEGIINSETDIDIVYKLYQVRKVIMSSNNRQSVVTGDVKKITCSDLSLSTVCNKLMEQLELRSGSTDNYVLIYTKSLTDTNVDSIKSINGEVAEYAQKHKSEINNSTSVLFLLDTKNHVIAHMYYTMREEPAICKRATTLHTQTCNNSLSEPYYTDDGSLSYKYYCHADGYYATGSKGTNVITFGNLGTEGSMPSTGDAFDCDVNDDGIYDPETERFYYVSNYFDTNTQTFDTERAVLIYYRHYFGGNPSDNGISYYGTESEYDNWHGPITAISALPNNKSNGGTWRDDLIKTADRKILSCNDDNCNITQPFTIDNESPSITKTIVYTTPIYNKKAARLLSFKELSAGCGTMNLTYYEVSKANCNFFYENTNYVNNSFPTSGIWMENPYYNDLNMAWDVHAYLRRINENYVFDINYGARPVIDVLYTNIEY